MNTESLKINITQRILNINNNSILEKISKLLDNENIMGYNEIGHPILESDYVADINEAIKLFTEGKLETYSSDQVKKKILG